MIQHRDPHTPTDEFRESLKRELMRAYRAEVQFGRPQARVGKIVAWVGIAAGAVFALTAGLVLGMNTGPAAAQVLETNRREVAATSLATRRQFAASRLAMARAVYDSVQHAYSVGTATKAQLDTAKSEVDSMEANAAQVEVDARTAPAPKPASCGSVLRAAPVKNALAALVCGAVASAQTPAPRRQGGGVPIAEVSAPTAKTTSTFGAILGVQEISNGRLLVNDAGNHLLKLFDPSLATASVVLDSTDGAANSYGTKRDQIIPYLGDSTIVTLGYGEPILLLDPAGHVARALAMPEFSDGVTPFPQPFDFPQVADRKGRLYEKGGTQVRGDGHGVGVAADSVLVLRADLSTRKVDVVGTLHQAVSKNRSDPPENGNRVVTTIVQPVPTEDSWAVLSDGTLAFVRGRDYHVDWVLPDGSTKSTDKLPFDWRRLTDDEKQKLADSAKVVWDSLMSIRNHRVNTPARAEGAGDGGTAPGRGRSSGGVEANGQAGSIQRMISVPLSEIPDYFPPIHRNAAMADLDGNLWVLTTTTAQSRHGELVYDVLNPSRGLAMRVRMPIGRSIAGFGRNGVLYLQAGDRAGGFTLERVRVQTTTSSK